MIGDERAQTSVHADERQTSPQLAVPCLRLAVSAARGGRLAHHVEAAARQRSCKGEELCFGVLSTKPKAFWKVAFVRVADLGRDHLDLQFLVFQSLAICFA